MESKNQTTQTNQKTASRRGFLSGIVLGATAGVLLGGKTPSAKADVAGGDTAVLTDISIWLKTTWISQVLPALKMIKDWYDTVKSWIQSWNEFVTTFNRAMNLTQDVRNFLVRSDDNWFYQSYIQLRKYINNMMKVDGDILKYRLHYYDPILIQKIDSTMFQIQYLSLRAKSMAQKYIKMGAKPRSNDPIRETKEGKLAIRASNDLAKYLDSISRISAIRQTVENTKSKVSELEKMNSSTENTAKIYHDLIAPQILEAALLQCSILSEIYMKMNDLFLMASKEDPLVSDQETIVQESDLKKLLFNLSKGNKSGFIF